MSTETTAARIAALAQSLDGTSITTLELRLPDEAISLRRAAGRAQPPPPTENTAAEAGQCARAPCPGVVLHSHPLRIAPLVQVGQAVAAGKVLALLRIGPLLVPVTAAAAGTIQSIAVPDGETVGYGTALVHLTVGEDA